MRDMMKNPFIAKNLEEVAGRYIAWIDKQAPGALDAMMASMSNQGDAARG